MMKRIFYLLLLSIFFLFAFQKAALAAGELAEGEDYLPNSGKKTQNSETLELKENSPEDSVWIISNGIRIGGTAFFISPQYVLTNFHVAEMLLNTGEIEDIFLIKRDRDGYFKIKDLVAVAPNPDLALFRIEGESENYLRLLEEETLQLPENFYSIGYPLGQFKETKKLKSATWCNQDCEEGFVFLSEKAYYDGASGSPILDEKGSVLGILKMSFINHEGHHIFFSPDDHISYNAIYATSVNGIKEFLNGNIGRKCSNDPKQCIDKHFMEFSLPLDQALFLIYIFWTDPSFRELTGTQINPFRLLPKQYWAVPGLIPPSLF